MNSLQQILIQDRARFIHFLSSRGAGIDAEDLFQDIFYRLELAKDGLVIEPSAYCFRVAENLLRDRLRTEASRIRRDNDWFEKTPKPADIPDCERTLLGRERLKVVDDALDALGNRASYVFRRFRIDGLPQAAIASELGISLSSIEKDLQKAYSALSALRRTFDPFGLE